MILTLEGKQAQFITSKVETVKERTKNGVVNIYKRIKAKVTLQPGPNTVSDAQWALLKEGPWTNRLIETKQLIVTKENKKALAFEELSVVEQLKVIEDTDDLAKLDSMLKLTNDVKIKEKIVSKMDSIVKK